MRSAEDVIRKYSTVCWYPSAGADFRVLLFLSKQYYRWKNIQISSDKLPDLFILTDCNPLDSNYSSWNRIKTDIEKLNHKYAFDADSLVLYKDKRTEIIATNVEILDKLDVQDEEKLFHFEKSANFGWAFYFTVHIKSKQLGEWDSNALYLLVENTWFALRYLFPRSLCVDYLIRVRYGDAFGGSVLSGEWLLKLIPSLKVKYYISNEVNDASFEYVPTELEEDYMELADIWKNTERINLEEFYSVNGRTWSDQDDIHWYQIMD